MSDKNVSELIHIVNAGAGITMAAVHYTAEDVLAVARKVGDAGVALQVHGAMDWPTKDLIEVAKAGKGRVVFT